MCRAEWHWGMTMDAVVSLEASGTDWLRLVRFVERSGQPLWLEADGEIRGVLLPAREARYLLGDRVAQGGTACGADDPGMQASPLCESWCLLDAACDASSPDV